MKVGGGSTSKNRAWIIVVILLFAVLASIIAIDAVFPIRYYDSVKKYCKEYDLDKSEVFSVIWTESKFRPSAKSKAGACGLMQLMPSTAKWICELSGVEYSDEKLFDPDFNIMLGTYYLNYLKGSFEGDYVYAAFNAGEGNVRKWLDDGGKIEFAETREYIKRIKFARGIYKFRIG